MSSPLAQPTEAPDPVLASRLRMTAALARCPLAAVYRVQGGRARLVQAHGAPKLCAELAPEAPAWRMVRAELAIVPVVGRGPAAPESAIFPVAFGVAALISAPIRHKDEVALVLLADSRPRPDLDELDRGALATALELVGEALFARALAAAASPARNTDPIELSGLPGHDPVTGLPDRRLLTRAIDHAIAEGRGLAVAIVALDRFQRVDDWLGHAVGDEVLRQVGARLLDTTGEHDLVGRGSGDELIVVLARIRSPSAAHARADRLMQAIREPFHVQGYELTLTATIGLSRFPDHASDAALLLRYAGIAMHRAKARRRGRLESFTPELKEAVEQRGDIERRLRRAIGAGELVLHYQPKIDLAAGRATGVEALIRWQRGDTMISPAQFLPVAEESELIVPIGTWVMLDACRQMRRWRDRGVPLDSVSVNVSALQFGRADFVGTVARSLESAGLAPKHLELEVTETSLMDDVHGAAERLAALRALGVRVSVDDFGTGYSSLAYLQRLPVDVLKIDRSFVKDLDATGQARDHAHALAQAITGLGHHLGLRVLAEGVETQAQLDAVSALGCDEVQGYFFSKPLPAAQIPAHLSAA